MINLEVLVEVHGSTNVEVFMSMVMKISPGADMTELKRIFDVDISEVGVITSHG